MTPKQKAKELVKIFFHLCTYDKDGLVVPVAKKAATIAVDEILSILPYQPITDRYGFNWIKFYQKVKIEIENLK